MMDIWGAFTDEQQHDQEKKSACPTSGGTCPACKKGTLSFNGKLELICSNCEAVFSFGFT